MNKHPIPATKSSVERGLLPVVLLSLALVVAAVPALNVALPNLAADTDASLEPAPVDRGRLRPGLRRAAASRRRAR